MNAPALEIGQLCFASNTQEHEVPEWVCSMLRGVYRRIAVAYWNTNQEAFETYGQYKDVRLGALSWRPYREGDTGCNLKLVAIPEGRERRGAWVVIQGISWYKNFGRSMTCTEDYTALEWIHWHDAVVAELSRVEKDWSDGRMRRYLTEG